MSQKDSISTRRTYMLLRSRMFELLTDTAFEKLTMTEICSAAMIPRSTFYRYFEDKYDLLRFCIKGLMEEMHLTEDVIYFKSRESMKEFLLILIQHIAANRAMYQKIYLTNKDGVLMQILHEDLKQLLTEQLESSKTQGYIPKISLPIFTTLLTNFYFGIITCYLEMEDQISIEEFVENVCMFADKDFFVVYS